MKAPAKFKSSLTFAFANFGPLIVFYALNHFFGLRAAILSTLVFTAIDWAIRKAKKEKLGSFYIYSVVITVVFGCFDLYLNKSIFFKFEAALTNFLMAAVFGVSLFGEKTLIQRIAEETKHPSMPNGAVIPSTPEVALMLKIFTVAWTLYFALKAVLYVWLASIYSLERFLVIRTIIGNVSLGAMALLSVVCGKPLFKLISRRRALASSST